mgnify:CR=1 FL=1
MARRKEEQRPQRGVAVKGPRAAEGRVYAGEPAAGTHAITRDMRELELLPGWALFSAYQRAFLVRRRYHATHIECAKAVGKNRFWYIHSVKHSVNFRAAIQWVMERTTFVPDYETKHMAREARHYLMQVLRGETKGEAQRITVARALMGLRDGNEPPEVPEGAGPIGVGRGGRRTFRPQDMVGLPERGKAVSVVEGKARTEPPKALPHDEASTSGAEACPERSRGGAEPSPDHESRVWSPETLKRPVFNPEALIFVDAQSGGVVTGAGPVEPSHDGGEAESNTAEPDYEYWDRPDAREWAPKLDVFVDAQPP